MPYSTGSGVKSVVVVCGVYMKIISAGSFTYFVKIRLNELLDFTGF